MLHCGKWRHEVHVAECCTLCGGALLNPIDSGHWRNRSESLPRPALPLLPASEMLHLARMAAMRAASAAFGQHGVGKLAFSEKREFDQAAILHVRRMSPVTGRTAAIKVADGGRLWAVSISLGTVSASECWDTSEIWNEPITSTLPHRVE